MEDQEIKKVLATVLALKDMELFQRVTWHMKATAHFHTMEHQVEDEDCSGGGRSDPTSPSAESNKADSMWDLPRTEEPQHLPTDGPDTS